MHCRPALAILSAPLLALFALAGCTAQDPFFEGPAKPMMWEMRDADSRIIFIASMHQLPQELDWQGAGVASAVAIADELLLELAPAQSDKAPALFSTLSADEPVGSLVQRFGANDATLVADMVLGAGIEEEDAQRIESWALALLIGNVQSADAGLSTDAGVEAQLTAAMQRRGRAVRGLESAEQQLVMFDTLPLAVQDGMVRSAIRHRRDAPARVRATVRAWAKGDETALTAIADAAVAEVPGMAEPLIHARNRAWAAMLAQRMDQPGTLLVAVGAGHLVGERSVIALLRAQGFVVRRSQ